MTYLEWRKRHRDSKSTSRVDGKLVRRALFLDPETGATVLEEVTLTGSRFAKEG